MLGEAERTASTSVTRTVLVIVCVLLLGLTATASAGARTTLTESAFKCANTRAKSTKGCSESQRSHKPTAKPKAKSKTRAKSCPKVRKRVRVKVKVAVRERCHEGRKCPSSKVETKSITKLVCAQAVKAQKPLTPPTAVVSVTQTSQDLSQTMAPQSSLQFSPAAPAAGTPVIRINDKERYQTFTGVGGAMTDTSAWLIWDELPSAERSQLLDALFSPSYADLSFLRLPMGASDFSANETPYTYDDLPAGQTDPSLSDFSIAHDEAYILPALRAARQLNPDLYLEAVPWSPPAWMKSSDTLDNPDNNSSLLPQDYPTLAQYFVKFLQAYAAQGVPVNAVTPQNEPGVATTYPSMELTEDQEANFVANYLDPALSAAHLAPNVFGWDLAWGPLHSGADQLVDQSADGTLTGLAWHCYYGSPTFMDGVHNDAPDSMQIVDECTTGSGDIWKTSELLIASLRNWANAVALWNLALDPSGGPVQPPNAGCAGCTGVATVDPQTGTYTLSPDYYELAQFSHFVHPGAVRIASPNFVSYTLGGQNNYQPLVTPGLDDVALLNPDGSRVLYLYNNSSSPITFAVQWDGSSVTYTIPAGATTTLTWR